MTREEVSKRFNALPFEHRATIIGNELEQEIRWLEREKREAIKAHAKNLERYNERIKILTRSLDELCGSQIKQVKDMKEEMLSIASDLREGHITSNEAKHLLLVLFGVGKSLPIGDVEILLKGLEHIDKWGDEEEERWDDPGDCAMDTLTQYRYSMSIR